ncbi:hypothetical protein ES705_48739 [subsurface metagenome]
MPSLSRFSSSSVKDKRSFNLPVSMPNMALLSFVISNLPLLKSSLYSFLYFSGNIFNKDIYLKNRFKSFSLSGAKLFKIILYNDFFMRRSPKVFIKNTRSSFCLSR